MYHDLNILSRTSLCYHNCFENIRYTFNNGITWIATEKSQTVELQPTTMRSKPYNLTIKGACSHNRLSFGTPVTSNITNWEICHFNNVPLQIEDVVVFHGRNEERYVGSIHLEII